MMYRWDKALPCLSEMYPVPELTARDKHFREHGMPTDNEQRAATMAFDDEEPQPEMAMDEPSAAGWMTDEECSF